MMNKIFACGHKIAPIQILSEHIRQYGLSRTLQRAPGIIACLDPRAYRPVAHSLSLSRTSKLKQYRPRLPFKYFGNYLASSLCARTRSAILAHHYRFLNELVTENFISRICEGKILLWHKCTGIGNMQITLTYPTDGYKEGELALQLWLDSTLAFTLSFTIAAGSHFGIHEEDHVIFVGRLQGTRIGKQIFREISKSMQEVSPPALLLAATQGIASTFKISAIVGINASSHICLNNSRPGDHAFYVYDEFWLSAGARKMKSGMYFLPEGMEEKPLSEIKAHHRSRVKRKRQLKHSITGEVAHSFQAACLDRQLQPSAFEITGLDIAAAAQLSA